MQTTFSNNLDIKSDKDIGMWLENQSQNPHQKVVSGYQFCLFPEGFLNQSQNCVAHFMVSKAKQYNVFKNLNIFQ